jgi:hypothetical protein
MFREFPLIQSWADCRFKNADGEFGKPEYTIPDADDGDADQEGGDEVAA